MMMMIIIIQKKITPKLLPSTDNNQAAGTVYSAYRLATSWMVRRSYPGWGGGNSECRPDWPRALSSPLYSVFTGGKATGSWC